MERYTARHPNLAPPRVGFAAPAVAPRRPVAQRASAPSRLNVHVAIEAKAKAMAVKVAPHPPHREPRQNLRTILKIVSAATGISTDDLTAHNRARRFARGRFIFYSLAYEVYGQHVAHMSMPYIGYFIQRDHTSILHGIRMSRELRKTDVEFSAAYSICEHAVRREFAIEPSGVACKT